MTTTASGGGVFIVLEGSEGVGKTTQWHRLAERLRAAGHDVVAVREPGGTAAGDEVRRMLLDPASDLTPEAEALLFAASRAQLLRAVVRPALARGALVLVDRFLLSTYAYQGAGRGLPLDELRTINHLATGGLVPHITLLLSMSLADAMTRMQARGATDRMERAGIEFHSRVQLAFNSAVLEEWQQQHPEIGPVSAVDASGTPDAVTDRCLARLAASWPTRFAGVGHD